MIVKRKHQIMPSKIIKSQIKLNITNIELQTYLFIAVAMITLPFILYLFLLKQTQYNYWKFMQESKEQFSPHQNDKTYLTESSPNHHLSIKKRKNKVISSRKTNEQLIRQSEEELMRYVDTVDQRVQQIMQTHEAQFLAAYQSHAKKVREELEQIKRKALNNASSEQVHIDQIESLNKQLTVFRDQSLKLFENIITKDQLIKSLRRANKQLSIQRENLSSKIYILTKRNRQLQFALTKITLKLNNGEVSEVIKQEQQQSQNKIDQSRFNHPSKQPFFDQYEPRPYTSAVRSNHKGKSLKMPLQSKKTSELSFNWLKKKVDEKMNRTTSVNMEAAFKTLDHKELEEQSKLSLHDFRKGKLNLQFKMAKRKSNFMDKDLMKLKCLQISEKNQMQQLFYNCVESIKKEIMRRNNIPSLNYFKKHGPKTFLQFKQIDYYALLELLLKNDVLLKRLYEIIFIVE